jgi:hypothetical protein
MSSSVRWGRALAVLFIGATSVALAGCSLLGGGSADPSPSGQSTDNSTDVFTIKVGDCVNDSAAQGEVSTVPKADCAQPHDGEAYASIMMADGEFPGADAVRTQSEAGCTAQFNTFVGVDYGTSALSYSYYYPTAESWAQGDREILCIVFDPVTRTVGSLKGAAR